MTEKVTLNIDGLLVIPITIGGAAVCLLVLWVLGAFAANALGFSNSTTMVVDVILALIAAGLLVAFTVQFLLQYFRGELTRTIVKQVAAVYQYQCNICGYQWSWDSRMPRAKT